MNSKQKKYINNSKLKNNLEAKRDHILLLQTVDSVLTHTISSSIDEPFP